MRTAKQYTEVTRINLRPEVEYCPFCQMRLRRTCTLGERTIVTCAKVLYLIHRGYRCPDKACPGHLVVYHSAAADALALSGFTFGLDVLILVGTLRLGRHYTLDEVHWALLERLGSIGVSISRREVLYLIETYGALLRAGSEVASDQQWLEQVRENGGMLLSIDGIQPDKGNETVYLVREVLTGRMLLAEPTHDSETETLKRLLVPIQAVAVPVQGIVSDAQTSLVCAIASLWPKVPHQICQIHALRDASKAIFEQDRKAKLAVRQKLQPKLIPTCVLRDTSKMGKVGHRTDALRISFQLIESIADLVYDLIERGKGQIRQVLFAHFFPDMFDVDSRSGL